MRQIITVGFDNATFQMDEHGYSALRQYLDRAKAGLAGNPDVNEILGDLERSIAEKCSAAIQSGKKILQLEDVRQILEQMGPVDGDDAPEQPAATEKAIPARKLYRLPRNGKLSGVCAGLAEYFGTDAVLVRIAFIALAFFGFIGVILYLVLEALMPSREQHFGQRFIALKLVLLFVLLMVIFAWFGSAGFLPRWGMFSFRAGMMELLFVPLFFASSIGYVLVIALVAIAAIKYLWTGSRARS